jgi:hypothetical protein
MERFVEYECTLMVDIVLERPNNWGRNHTDYVAGWLHSDIINMVFFYNYKLFEDIISKGVVIRHYTNWG